MKITTQEWGPVPDGYDYLEPLRSSMPCIVIQTTTMSYLALYRVVQTITDEGAIKIERFLITFDDLR